MCRRSVPAWFGYHCYPKLTFHVRQRISSPPYIELIRTMKLLHSGFFFFLFHCALVQPVHTWRINSTKMQRLQKLFLLHKIQATIFGQIKPIQMWPMQMKPLQIYSMQMYPVKSANSNIGNANTRCQRRHPSLGGVLRQS